MKRTDNVSLRVSEPVKKALVHIAKTEEKPESAVLADALVAFITERGLSLPPECPEYRVSEAARGSLNAQLAELMDKAVPVARERCWRWAEENAISRFGAAWQRVQYLDHPALYNAALELFSDAKRTPRERLRALEFRVRTFEEDMAVDRC
jgi:hypothetical protein